MKKSLNYLVIFLFTAVIGLSSSCNNDDDNNNPAPVVESEVITSVKLSVTEAGATSPTVYTWKKDNQDKITLKANKTYNFKIQFLNESDPNDVKDVNEEIIEEKDIHFVYYETTVAGLTFAKAADDTIDSKDIAINLSTDWTTQGAGTGIIKGFLIHEPTTKTGSKREDFGGETDIEVNFDVTVEATPVK